MSAVEAGQLPKPDPKRNTLSALPDKPHRKFSSDDINFYDFELIEIKRSGGIFAIQLDERRIAGKRERNKAKRAHPRHRLLHSAGLVWNQIRHIAEVLDNAGLFAWDLQCLGSDFDGIINPIDGCFTAEYYQNLMHFLLIHAREYVTNEMPDRIQLKANRIDAEEIVHRFFQQNAMEFLKKNFRKGSKVDQVIVKQADGGSDPGTAGN